MSLRNLLIRADASAEIGVGHVMRCIALAESWQEAGGHAIFVLAKGAEDLDSRIRFHGAEVITIQSTPGGLEDAARTSQLVKNCGAEWLVLDGYHFSSDYLRALDGSQSRFLMIADGEQVPSLNCDIFVNPDPTVLAETRKAGNGRAELLFGPQYALLRKEFLKHPIARERHSETATRILVTLGGGDSHNVTLQVLRALLDIGDLKLDLTVIVGPSNPHLASLEGVLENSRHSVNLFSKAANMPELMSQADLAITAGGGTCYELAFMKVPMFLIITAQNQEHLVRALHKAGAGVDAGWFSSVTRQQLAGSLRDMICNQKLRGSLAANARRMVDGRGAGRIVTNMHAICRRDYIHV